MRSGAHVFIEKPLARTVQEAEQVAAWFMQEHVRGEGEVPRAGGSGEAGG